MKHSKSEAKNQKETEKMVDDTKVKVTNSSKDDTNSTEELANEEKPECSELEATQMALEELQSKYNQLNDTYLRALAEYDNYRKRTLKEKADLIKTGGESVLINILNIVDDVERGIASSKMTQDVDTLHEGMELILNKFQGFLKQSGIREIEAAGETFDTDHHEAIATIPAPDESQKGKVIDCVQKGYYLHDKVIRFAKVVVGE